MSPDPQELDNICLQGRKKKSKLHILIRCHLTYRSTSINPETQKLYPHYPKSPWGAPPVSWSRGPPEKQSPDVVLMNEACTGQCVHVRDTSGYPTWIQGYSRAALGGDTPTSLEWPQLNPVRVWGQQKVKGGIKRSGTSLWRG